MAMKMNKLIQYGKYQKYIIKWKKGETVDVMWTLI